MALEGTLRDFSLADIFQLIGLQRKTGVLSLRSEEDVVTVSFVDGKVVGADSVNKRIEDRLGQVLLRTGLMTPDELEIALQEQMETLERLGRILLRRGTLQRDQLRTALQQQILQIIYRVFRWQDGDYQFSQETSVDYDAELTSPITAESVLMEGARMLDEWPIIERRIPQRSMVFIAIQSPAAVAVADPATDPDFDDLDLGFLDEAPAPAPPTDTVQVTSHEFDVLRLVDGRRTVDEIILASPHGEFDTCKALYTMLTRGLVREASMAEQARAYARPTAETSELRRGVPWLFLFLVPVLAVSQLLAPRNPLNPLMGPPPHLVEHVEVSRSRARMSAVWDTIHAYAFLIGSYPDTLAELVRSGALPARMLTDPWGRPYRYVVRDRSLLLAGNGPQGTATPQLILTQRLLGTEEDTPDAPAVVLLDP